MYVSDLQTSRVVVQDTVPDLSSESQLSDMTPQTRRNRLGNTKIKLQNLDSHITNEKRFLNRDSLIQKLILKKHF